MGIDILKWMRGLLADGNYKFALKLATVGDNQPDHDVARQYFFQHVMSEMERTALGREMLAVRAAPMGIYHACALAQGWPDQQERALFLAYLHYQWGDMSPINSEFDERVLLGAHLAGFKDAATTRTDRWESRRNGLYEWSTSLERQVPYYVKLFFAWLMMEFCHQHETRVSPGGDGALWRNYPYLYGGYLKIDKMRQQMRRYLRDRLLSVMGEDSFPKRRSVLESIESGMGGIWRESAASSSYSEGSMLETAVSGVVTIRRIILEDHGLHGDDRMFQAHRVTGKVSLPLSLYPGTHRIDGKITGIAEGGQPFDPAVWYFFHMFVAHGYRFLYTVVKNGVLL